MWLLVNWEKEEVPKFSAVFALKKGPWSPLKWCPCQIQTALKAMSMK